MSTKQVVKKEIKELAAVFNGDLDLVLFFLEWIKNGQNGTKAYQTLNPGTDPASAAVLASRLLKKVNIDAVLEIYGIGFEKYMEQLRDGLTAEKSDITGTRFPDHQTRKPYHDKLGKLLGIESTFDLPPQTNVQINFTRGEENE